MATFSLGNSGVAPGAPGVYINERPGAFGVTAIAPFSTVYMLVETEEGVPVTRFPFNTPIAITSLNDYKALTAVSTKLVPTERIPLLSYNCVNEFFQNAQVGDLRVVRVGSPNQIVEIELLPSGQKINNTDLPSNLKAGDRVYFQLEINGIPVVAGDGTTGYDTNGRYLGVPVIIPVDYIPGDDVNNRKISAAMATALATAVETNPAVRSSVYVRSFGLVNDLPGQSSTNQNGYVSIAAATFNGDVNVITGVNPVGNQYVFAQGAYDIQNIVGQSASLVRTPQDYTQCISTAFDGQQDQGYLITPTAYAQFDALGRAAVGAAAAALCENNNYKWMALADPGPYLVTDINEYSQFSPHEPAEDLVQGLKYLINNVIYQWTGADVSYERANYQTIQSGSSAEIAVTESVTNIGAGQKIGLLDKGVYDAQSQANAKIQLSNANWPVTYEIQEVVLSGATATTNPFNPYNGQQVYVVAPPKNSALSGDYPLNVVYLAETATAAQNILAQVTAAGGSDFQLTAPAGAINVAAGAACTLTYALPAWDLNVNINGQTSDLVENTTDTDLSFNTLHLPGTLQSATANYRLGFQSRTIFDPAASIASYSGSVATAAGAAVITAVGHGLVNSQKVYFTQPVTTTAVPSVTVFKATSKIAQVPYYVTVLDPDTFLLSSSLTAFSAQSYIPFPSGPIATLPTIFYTSLLGGTETSTSLTELEIVPAIRGRKYGFASGSIDNQAADAAVAPAPSLENPGVSIWLNNSTQVLGDEQVVAWGETTDAGWLPKLELVDPGDITDVVGNFICVPTVAQSFSSQSYLVPSIDPILGGSYAPGTPGSLSGATQYALAVGLIDGSPGAALEAALNSGSLTGVYFDVTANGTAPDNTTIVVSGDRLIAVSNGTTYSWQVVPPAALGGDLGAYGQICYGSSAELSYTEEQVPPVALWRFDAITSEEIISEALRGVGFNGVPQAVEIEAGVDNVARLLADSKLYGNAFGFIAYYGPYIQNGAGQWIPPSPYVSGVALRRYRAEGYQFPPAGTKFQLVDAVAVQIPINSAQQNLLNPEGCNAIRTLPGYPQNAIYIWGGRTRLTNPDDAQQKLYQFVNTRVILNVVYGSLRTAFDSQIFNVIDGFGVVFNQIVNVGNSVLNELYARGALFGAKPSDAFQVICDERINSANNLENGIVNAKVFVTPVPTLERIQIDLIRVAIGQMQNELNAQGLGQNNSL